MYSISIIDRSNLGYAMIAGMDTDLDLTVTNRYTIVVMVFFVAYMLVAPLFRQFARYTDRRE
jgi:hypothetical protein